MYRRFEKFCAFWLVAQIVLPFTAPFPTCDLSDLLGGTPHHVVPLGPSNPPSEGDYAFTPPLATTAGGLKLVVVSSVDVSTVVGIERSIDPVGSLTVAFRAQRRPPELQPTVLRL